MTNETISDIVREMREYRIDECDRNWCDRIEAAIVVWFASRGMK